MTSRAPWAWRLLAAASAVWLAAALSRGWVAWTPAFAWAACAWAALWTRAGGRPWRESPTAFVFLTCLAFDLGTFCDRIESGSLAGARIDDRAGKGKDEK